MLQPDRGAATVFSQPVRQIVTMLAVIGLTGAGAYIAFPRVAPVFLANPWLNGFILFVFLIGLAATVWQVLSLIGSVSWIEGFAAQRPGHEMVRPPRLLTPLAALLRSRGRQRQINASSARSILDSVATRIDEARDITRYITNLLIFLGLLGTFYGLATTVPAVVETIRSLNPREGEAATDVFARLMTGLEAQLGGMGVAFSSSLLGLAGSLVIGLLELLASHGQNRFYRELEEWLSTITRLGFAGGDSEGGGEGAAVTALLDHMAEQMDALRAIAAGAEDRRAIVDERLGTLASAVERLTDRLQSEETSSAVALQRIAASQERLTAALLAQAESEDHVEAEARMRLRSIDVQLLRILEEISAGRQESIAEIRGDLTALTRAIRALSTSEHAQPGRRG